MKNLTSLQPDLPFDFYRNFWVKVPMELLSQFKDIKQAGCTAGYFASKYSFSASELKALAKVSSSWDGVHYNAVKQWHEQHAKDGYPWRIWLGFIAPTTVVKKMRISGGSFNVFATMFNQMDRVYSVTINGVDISPIKLNPNDLKNDVRKLVDVFKIAPSKD